MGAKILTTAIHKGGEGKTTSTIQFAAYLAGEKNQKVCLIDMDPSSNATITVIDGPVSGLSVVDVLLGKTDLLSIMAKTRIPGLDLIPASNELKGFSMAAAKEPSMEFRLLDLIEGNGLKEAYDFILIDSPPSLELLTVNALAASEWFLVPLRCASYSVKGLVDLSAFVAKLKQRVTPNLKLLGIFITQFRGWNRLDRNIYESIENYLLKGNQPLLKTIIRESVVVRESIAERLPVWKYNPKADVSRDYLLLCDEIFNKIGFCNQIAEQVSGGVNVG